MTLFDISVSCILGLSVVVGMTRGLISEVLSLATWLLALSVAKLSAGMLGETVLSMIQPPALAAAGGFILAFTAVLLLMFLLRTFLTKSAKAVGLGGVNRLLGALFGLLRGFIVVTLAVLVCSFTDIPQSEDWQRAASSAFFEGAASVAVPYLPDYLAQKVRYPSF